MSVDATQFIVCAVQKSSKLCFVDESEERPPVYVLPVKHVKSVELTHSRVKTDIEPWFSLPQNISKA